MSVTHAFFNDHIRQSAHPDSAAFRAVNNLYGPQLRWNTARLPSVRGLVLTNQGLDYRVPDEKGSCCSGAISGTLVSIEDSGKKEIFIEIFGDDNHVFLSAVHVVLDIFWRWYVAPASATWGWTFFVVPSKWTKEWLVVGFSVHNNPDLWNLSIIDNFKLAPVPNFDEHLESKRSICSSVPSTKHLCGGKAQPARLTGRKILGRYFSTCFHSVDRYRQFVSFQLWCGEQEIGLMNKLWWRPHSRRQEIKLACSLIPCESEKDFSQWSMLLPGHLIPLVVQAFVLFMFDLVMSYSGKTTLVSGPKAIKRFKFIYRVVSSTLQCTSETVVILYLFYFKGGFCACDNSSVVCAFSCLKLNK